MSQESTNRWGISLRQATLFPQRFDSWLGGVVVSLDNHFMVLGGQGLELRATRPKVLSIGDKILIKISDDHFKEWLRHPDFVCDTMELKVLTQALQTPCLLTPHRCQQIELWNHFIETIREYFKSQGFIETPTPSLVPCPGFESTLQPFSTTLFVEESPREFFLPTSPELHLKKLLSQGWSEIFEIKQSFRNGEYSPHHQPEFTLLEWYRAYDLLNSLVEDIQNLLVSLCEKEFIVGPLEPCQQHSIAQLFFKFTGLQLTPFTQKKELVKYCQRLNQPTREEDSWDDIFHLIFIHQIESHLGRQGPELVYNFPPSQAILAQINEEGWAERFELYWRGFEIGNAFNELLSPIEHKKRFHKEMALREKKGYTKVPMDEDFMMAVHGGLPPCVGMAIGLERLFLACQGMDDLKELRLFPFAK